MVGNGCYHSRGLLVDSPQLRTLGRYFGRVVEVVVVSGDVERWRLGQITEGRDCDLMSVAGILSWDFGNDWTADGWWVRTEVGSHDGSPDSLSCDS